MYESSEDALAALEKSKDDFNALLDAAANIASVKYRPDQSEYVTTEDDSSGRTHDNSSSFKEQWLLKWLLKRLINLSTKLGHDSSTQNSSVLDCKTWAFLRHLIQTIAPGVLIDILVERRFTSLLVSLGTLLHNNNRPVAGQSSRNLSQPSSTDGISTRSSKRLRMSAEPDETHLPMSSIASLYLHVVKLYGTALEEISSCHKASSSATARKSGPVWATSIGEASKLLACTLKICKDLLHHSGERRQHWTLDVITQWCRLWQDFSTSLTVSKDDVHQSFCQNCLNPAFELSKLVRSRPGSKATESERALERQIAIHVVIPLRSLFNEKFSHAWKAERKVIAWNNIMPVYEMLKKHLHGALLTESIMGVDFVSLEQSSFAADLIAIASRLVPFYDLRRRRLESTWLEALSLSLLHMAYPNDVPRLVAAADGLLTPENQYQPLDLVQVWPEEILLALQENQIGLSLPVASYLHSSIFLGRAQSVPVKVLTHLVKISVDVFVPQNLNPNTGECLNQLLSSITDRPAVGQDEYSAIVQHILIPLMRMHGRTRELSSFLDIWLLHMQNAFSVRALYSTTSSDIESLLVWADEDLLIEFEEQLRIHPGQIPGLQLLTDFSQILGEMPSRIGPTADIFARLTILLSVLKVKGADLVKVDALQGVFESIIRNTVIALSQQTDYQGQRWRLWDLLNHLYNLIPGLIHVDDVEGLLQNKAPFASTSSLEDFIRDARSWPTYLLTECLHSFAAAVNIRPLTSSFKNSALDVSLQHLISLLQHHMKQSPATPSTISNNENFSWSGRNGDMKSSRNLLCGYLAIFLKSITIKGTSGMQLFPDIFLDVAYQTSKQVAPDDSHDCTLAHLIHQISEAICRVDGRSLFKQYLKLYIADTGLAFPSRLHTLPMDDVDTGSMHRYQNLLAEKLNQSILRMKPTDDERLAAQIMLLARLLRDRPLPTNHSQPLLLLADPMRQQSIFQKRRSLQADPTRAKSVRIDSLSCCTVDLFTTLWSQIMQHDKSKAQSKLIEKLLEWCLDIASRMSNDQVLPEEIVLVDVVVILAQSNEKCLSLEALLKVKQCQENIQSSLRHAPYPADHEHKLQILGKHSTNIVAYINDRAAHANTMLVPIGEQTSIHSKDYSRLERTDTDRTRIMSSSASGEADLHSEDVLLVVQEAHDILQDLDSAESVDLGKWLSAKHSSTQTLLPRFILAKIISDLRESDVSFDGQLARVLGKLACLQGVTPDMPILDIKFNLELSERILTMQPGVIGQAAVDSLLEALVAFTTSAGSPTSIKDSLRMERVKNGAILTYDRVLAVVGILMSRYRRRLNGRSHLFIQLLRNLLRCLFYTPDRTYIYQNAATIRQRQAFKASMPVWLDQHREGPLPSESAERYSRILSSICNPTEASARSAQRTRKRSAAVALELNDETAKAKRIASRYMQYILMEYSKCMLEGVIMPEARERLIPGLFSIMDALDRETVKAMNSAMDPSCRAVFKGLYDDWVKFGRWDQT